MIRYTAKALDDFHRNWKIWLATIGKSETRVAKEMGQTQGGLNKKIVQGTIKFLELQEILHHYGYRLKLEKED